MWEREAESGKKVRQGEKVMVLLTYSSDSHVEEGYFSHIQGPVLFSFVLPGLAQPLADEKHPNHVCWGDWKNIPQ